jgi:hypothetical protein
LLINQVDWRVLCKELNKKWSKSWSQENDLSKKTKNIAQQTQKWRARCQTQKMAYYASKTCFLKIWFHPINQEIRFSSCRRSFYGAICMQSSKKHFMPVLVRDYHLLHNLLEFLLAASTAPFIFGLYRDEFECLIFYFAQSSTIILSLKS